MFGPIREVALIAEGVLLGADGTVVRPSDEKHRSLLLGPTHEWHHSREPLSRSPGGVVYSSVAGWLFVRGLDGFQTCFTIRIVP